MKIRQLRLMNNMSQKDFARQFNIAQNTLSQYENELRKPDPDLIKAIATTYHVPTDYLLDADQICDDRIGSALKSERQFQKYSISDISRMTKIPVEDLKNYEDDVEPINLYLLKKICDVYAKSIYEFYQDNEMYDEYIPEIFNGDVDAYEHFKNAIDEDAMRVATDEIQKVSKQAESYGAEQQDEITLDDIIRNAKNIKFRNGNYQPNEEEKEILLNVMQAVLNKGVKK